MLKRLKDSFTTLSKRKKTAITIAIVIAILLISPLAVKAATDGEVDLYAMVTELFVRVENLEAENEDLRAKVDDLTGQLGQVSQGDGSELNVTGEEEPASDSGNLTNEPIQPASEPEPEPANEPEKTTEPEPPPPNPYKDLSLSGVHVAMIDYRAAFGEWEITANGETTICFSSKEKDHYEARYTEQEIEFTTKSLSVDSRLYDITAGKKFGSRTEVINYIESVIAGTIQP